MAPERRGDAQGEDVEHVLVVQEAVRQPQQGPVHGVALVQAEGPGRDEAYDGLVPLAVPAAHLGQHLHRRWARQGRE